MKNNYQVIATRTRSGGRVVNQTLCLTNGISKRYRIYTSDDGGYTESLNDVVPVEFDMASDLSLATVLIKSFWRLHISSVAIEKVLQENHGKSA